MKNDKLAVVYALLAVAMWSTVATAFKLSLQQLSLIQLLAGASLTSTLVLAIALAIRSELRTALVSIRANWLSIVLLAAMNPVLYYLVLFKAYELLPAQVAQSLNYTWAITLTVLSVPILGHKLTRNDVLAIVLAYCGVLCISWGGKSLTGSLNVMGITMALLSTLIWAGYWLLNARDQRPPIIKLFQSFLLATPVLMLLAGEQMLQVFSLAQLAAMAYVGLFEMGLAFICWQLAMHYTTRVSRIGTLIFLSPFASLMIISVVLKEPIHPLTFIGLLLIVGGVIWQQYRTVADTNSATGAGD